MTGAADGSFEAVLAETLARLERDGPGALQAVLAAHPQHAKELQRHLERLRQMGLLTALAPDAAPTPAELDPPPARIGDFRLLQRLGSGGMGVVHLAEQLSLGRRVALKLVRTDFAQHPNARERFRREVEAVARLQHPGIVPVYAAGEDQGLPWLAMEHVLGATLEEVLQRLRGRDPATLRGADLQREVAAVTAPRGAPGTGTGSDTTNTFAGSWTSACLRIARSIALALQHAHERGVLHRDVKPSNVMLTPDGRVLLLDFGLALSLDEVRLTRTGHSLGTPAYMSPEQMRGDTANIDARTDVWSLGITLYELLTLRIPFAATTAHGIRDQALAGNLTPLRSHLRSIPLDVERVVHKALDPEVAHRYGDIAAFAADLTNLLELRPVTAAPPSSWRMLRRWSQRHPARAVAIVAGVLLLVGFVLQQQLAKAEIERALTTARDQERIAKTQEALAKTALQAARTQRDRAREVVDTLLTEVADSDLVEQPRLQPLRLKLLAAARAHYERFVADDADDPEVLEAALRAAMRVVFLDGEMGRIGDGLGVAARAVELGRRLRQLRPGDLDPAVLLADALLTHGRLLQLRTDLAGAAADYDEAQHLLADVLAREPRNASAQCNQLGVLRGRTMVALHRAEGDAMQQALATLNETWDRVAPWLLTQADERDAAVNHVLCANADVARNFAEQGDAEHALQTLDRCDAIARAMPIALTTPSRLLLGQLATLRAGLRSAEDDPAGQEAALRDCIRLADSVLADNPTHTNALRSRAASTNDLALLLLREPGRTGEALPLLDDSLAILRRLVANDPSVVDNRANLAATLVNLGSLRMDAGELQAAKTLFHEAADVAAACVEAGPDRETWRVTYYNAVWFLGQVHELLGDPDGLAHVGERLLDIRPDDARTHRIAAQMLSAAAGVLANAIGSAGERHLRITALTRRAMDLLQRAADLGCTDHGWLRDNPAFAPLRALPGFAELQARMEANAKAAGGR